MLLQPKKKEIKIKFYNKVINYNNKNKMLMVDTILKIWYKVL